MDLRTEILKEYSKEHAEKIAKWVGKDAARFAELMDLFLHDEYRVVQRAVWILSLVAEKYPAIAMPYQKAMVKRIAEPAVPDAVKRNVLRTLQFMDIDEELHGDVMNVCFDFLANPQEAIAIRVFSMTVLGNLAKKYPDIKQELKAIIEDTIELGDASAGFLSRAKKVLKKL